jgi:hypothetical protein
MQRQPGQIVHETLPQEKKSCKRAGGVAESVDPEFKPQYFKKKKSFSGLHYPDALSDE